MEPAFGAEIWFLPSAQANPAINTKVSPKVWYIIFGKASNQAQGIE
jgi:hypothetical protein